MESEMKPTMKPVKRQNNRTCCYDIETLEKFVGGKTIITHLIDVKKALTDVNLKVEEREDCFFIVPYKGVIHVASEAKKLNHELLEFKEKIKCPHCHKDTKIFIDGIKDPLTNNAIMLFKCELCDKQFSYSADIEVHCLLHIDPRSLCREG
jgi:DNA-directed RNA polymerase subunit RPC12/RpoP